MRTLRNAVAGSIVGAWLALSAHAALPPLPAAAAGKLDPALTELIATAPDSSISVWVEFADKGESGPDDLAVRLAAARSALTERALRRRLRAGVSPLVDYRDLPVCEGYLDQLRRLGFVPYGASRWLNRVAVRGPSRAWPALAGHSFVQKLSRVERVSASRDPEAPGAPVALPMPLSRVTTPDPADYGVAWTQLDQIQLPALHDSGYIGSGVLICMLDDGFFNYRVHDALKDIVVPPGHVRNFIDGNTDVEDLPNGGSDAVHGALTLGCVGGKKPGAYLGSAYGASFALARTEYDPSETPIEMVYWGMGAEWADSLGADIISSSLGYTTFDDPFPDYTYADMDGHTTTVTRAAEIAAEKGILVVNSAGNEGAGFWHYVVAPGDVSGDSALAVGAVTSSGTLASFSSRGPTSDGRIKPDVVAMGQQVFVPFVTGSPSDYTTVSGTSFSAPIVAGVAACLLQAHPTWTPPQLSAAIRLSADRAATPDNDYGYGLVRALAAHAYPVGVDPRVPPRGVLALRGPNPFSAGAGTAFDFRFDGPIAGEASLDIYDVRGARVRQLWHGRSRDASLIRWDGTDDEGRTVPSGVYWARLSGPGISSHLAVVALR